MQKTIAYNEDSDEFVITLVIPKTQRGTYMLDPEHTWEQDAVCVWIDRSRGDYALAHAHYLDYKDSLQATAPIIYFVTEKEAVSFAEKYKLMIEYRN